MFDFYVLAAVISEAAQLLRQQTTPNNTVAQVKYKLGAWINFKSWDNILNAFCQRYEEYNMIYKYGVFANKYTKFVPNHIV